MTDFVEPLAAAIIRVRALVAAAREAQWQPGQVVRPREDTTERSKGTTSDPTFAAVSDPRRLRLRLRVIEAERALLLAGRQLQAAERNLTDAIEEWQA